MRRVLTGVALGCLLSGCAVGPNFHAPDPPDTSTYQRSPPPTATAAAPAFAGDAQSFIAGAPPERWWTAFGSEELNETVRAALAANLDLATAQLSLRQAQTQLAIARGAALPVIDASYQAQRTRSAQTLSPPLFDNRLLYTLHTAQVTVAYTPDVFGGIRRATESSKAQAEEASHQLTAARVTLVSNTVLAVLQCAALRKEIETTEASVAEAREILGFIERRRALGDAAEAEAAQQMALISQAEFALPGLRKSLEQQRTVLSLLLSRTPSADLPKEPDFDGLVLPAHLPVTLPAALVKSRPDILAASDRLHAASAAVGVAMAARLPTITLSAVGGGVSTQLSDILSDQARFWSLASGVAQPILHAGALAGQQRIAQADLEKARNQYRSTVLSAFGQVSDALTALQRDAEALKIAVDGRSAADRSLAILTTRARLGDAGLVDLLIAQESRQQVVLTLRQAQVQRFADTVALFQALGAGSGTVESTRQKTRKSGEQPSA